MCVQVSMPEARAVVMAATKGRLGSPSALECQGRWHNNEPAEAASTTMYIPCTAEGEFQRGLTGSCNQCSQH